MTRTDSIGGFGRAALRVAAAAVAVVGAVNAWRAATIVLGGRLSGIEAMVEASVTLAIALVALALLVAYTAGELLITGRELRATPLWTLQVAATAAVVVVWLVLGVLSQTTTPPGISNFPGVAWLAAAVAIGFCGTVVLRSVRDLVRQFGGESAPE